MSELEKNPYLETLDEYLNNIHKTTNTSESGYEDLLMMAGNIAAKRKIEAEAKIKAEKDKRAAEEAAEEAKISKVVLSVLETTGITAKQETKIAADNQEITQNKEAETQTQTDQIKTKEVNRKDAPNRIKRMFGKKALARAGVSIGVAATVVLGGSKVYDYIANNDNGDNPFNQEALNIIQPVGNQSDIIQSAFNDPNATAILATNGNEIVRSNLYDESGIKKEDGEVALKDFKEMNGLPLAMLAVTSGGDKNFEKAGTIGGLLPLSNKDAVEIASGKGMEDIDLYNLTEEQSVRMFNRYTNRTAAELWMNNPEKYSGKDSAEGIRLLQQDIIEEYIKSIGGIEDPEGNLVGKFEADDNEDQRKAKQRSLNIVSENLVKVSEAYNDPASADSEIVQDGLVAIEALSLQFKQKYQEASQ